MISASLQNESLDTFTLGDTMMSNLTFTWSQELPYPGKRALRTEAARTERGVAVAEAERVRRALHAEVKLVYVELHRIERVRELVEDSRGLLLALRDVTRARFETGDAPLEGTLGAGAELARIDAELAELSGARAEAEARLGRLLGRRETGGFDPAVLPPLEMPLDTEALALAGSRDSSRLGLLRAAERRDEALVAALRREVKPDFSWNAGYAYRGSLDPMVMGMFGVKLPIYRERKQARAILGAERSLAATRHEAADAEIEAAAVVRETLARAASLLAQSRILREAAIPQSRAALEAATAAFASGRVDFATTLGHARSLLEDSRNIENLLAERRRLLALLEITVGTELLLAPGVPS
jgi:outer membrane protein TolC